LEAHRFLCNRHLVYRDAETFFRGWRLVSSQNLDVLSEWIGQSIFVRHGLVSSPNNVPPRIPQWCLIALSITLAAAPWLRWRFSLRTLLLATTLVAVLLWLFVAMR
jgi:hypothetical protein